MKTLTQPLTLITLPQEQFIEYLTQAIEKGKEIEREKGIEIPFMSEKEVMARFGYSKPELDARVKNRIFKRYKDGNKKVFYEINPIIEHIKNNEVYGTE